MIITREDAWVEPIKMVRKVYNNSSVPTVTEFDYSSLSGRKSVGRTQPGFRELIARGVQAGTPFVATSSRVSGVSPGSFVSLYEHRNRYGSDFVRVTYEGVRTAPFFVYADYNVPPSSFSVVVRDRALSQFYAKMREEYRKFDSSVFSGEMRETVQMLRSPLAGMRSLLRRYARRAQNVSPSRRRRNQDQLIRDLSNQWLETAFGFRPLVNDVQQILDLGNKVMSLRTSSNLQAAAGGTSQTARDVFTNVSLGGDNPNISGTTTRFATSSDTCLFKGAVSIDPYVNTLGYNLGLDVTNFVPTLYELMPWSFLIDYFSNLGNVISAWSTYKANLRWACSMQRNSTTNTFRYEARSSSYTDAIPEWGEYWTYTVTGGSCSVVTEGKRFERKVYDSATLPIPGVHLDLGLSLPQLTNILALLGSRDVFSISNR